MQIFHLFKYILSQHPKRLPVVLVILTISGLLESVGIGAVIPIFEFFFQNRSYETDNIISSTIFKLMDIIHLPVSLPGLFSLIIGLFFVKSSFAFIQSWMLTYIVCTSYEKTTRLFFSSILETKWAIFQKEKHGQLLNLFSAGHLIHLILDLAPTLLEVLQLLFYLYLGNIAAQKPCHAYYAQTNQSVVDASQLLVISFLRSALA